MCRKLDKNDNEKVEKLLHFNGSMNEENIELTYLDNHILQLINDFIDKKEGQMVNVSREDLNKIQDLCNSFGVPCIQSENEAETLCCKLSKNIKKTEQNNLNSIGVISEDTDVLAYGCELFICDLNVANGDCNVIYLPSLLETMEMEYQQFLEFCILSGTDYNTNIPGIGSVKCYDWILKHKSINNIFDNEKKTIQKKIDDYNSKKEKIEIQDEESILDESLPLEKIDMDSLKKTMIHSIDMFDTVQLPKSSRLDLPSQTNYWSCNLNINNITEMCLRYNIHSEYILDGRNGIINLWNNKIKLK